MENRHSRVVGSDSRLKVSFEFFPPKTEQMEETLWRSVERLAPLSPSFVSVTYGAGGSTRERTERTVRRILKESSVTPAAHLTCVDASPDMLTVARANLDRAGLSRAQVRLGDVQHLPFVKNSFDVVTIHQVLHYLDEPERAIAEAARVLRPGGRLLVVDFAPHGLEFLRERHAHRRLGFARQAMSQWLEAPGLAVEKAVDLAPPPSVRDALTVTLWLARDKRIAVAADPSAREVA